MKAEVVVFDKDYFDIPLQDMPGAGGLLIVCHDPKNRLKGDKHTVVTWAVCKTTSDEGGSPPIALGLFWDKAQAVFFANAVACLSGG